MDKDRKKPFCTVRVKSVTVPIYKNDTRNKVTGKVYPAYIAYYYDEKGKRIGIKSADLEKLKKTATEKAGAIARGDVSTINLTAQQAAAWKEVERICATIGKSPIAVAEEYKEAFIELPKQRSMLDCVRFTNEKLLGTPISKPVADVITEFIQTKKVDGVSHLYLQKIGQYLKRFSNHFQCPIDKIIGSDIDTWLRSLQARQRKDDERAPAPLSPRSRNNLRGAIQTLFTYAKSKRYVPRDYFELESVPVAKARIEKIEIFTPEEMSKLLTASSETQLPFVAIFAFSGVRHEEIKRLRWENVRWDSKYIAVNADVSKVSVRRLVPISDNLLEWLLPYRKKTGPICEYSNMTRQLLKIAAKAKVTWKKNAPRHSFISYRVAATQDVAKVALESGNSPKKIFSNYREIVTPEDAKSWFDLRPGVGTVTNLLQKRA